MSPGIYRQLNLTLRSEKIVSDHTILQPDAGDCETIVKLESITYDVVTFDAALQVLEADDIHIFY